MSAATTTTTTDPRTIVLPDGSHCDFIPLTQNETQKQVYPVKGEICMSECGKFMIVPREDDAIILLPKYTHYGAFGKDRMRVEMKEGGRMCESKTRETHTHWLVWKIPGDLTNVIELPKGLFIQVGTYHLHSDDGKKGPPATKLRMVKGTAHLHKLVLDDGSEYAMVSSSILIRDGLGGHPNDLIKIARSLQTTFELDVFSCHCQQHALVFRQSPQEFAKTLIDTPEIITHITTFAPPYEKERIEQWGRAYIEAFA